MAIVLENYNGARKLIATGAPQQEIDDSVIAPDRMWSSKKLIEISTSQFETTGNPVAVSPFAYSPLGVKINFTPKQSGTGDPSPQNVRPITGWDEVTVNERGKNLFDADSGFAVNGDAPTYGFGFDGEFFKEGITYTFSAINATDTVNIKVSYASYGENNLFVSIPVGGSQQVAFHRNPNAAFPNLYIFLQTGGAIYGDGDGVAVVSIEEAKALGLQIEASSTPTPYEPYQPGTTATLTLPETIYGGTVDAVTGVGKKTWEFVEFDGTENWYVDDEYYYCRDAQGSNNIDDQSLCNVAPFIDKYTPAANPIDKFFITISGSGFVEFSKFTYATVENFKSYLAAQASAGTPVTVCYKLATPSAFTSDGYKTIQPLEDVNTIYSDTNSVTVSGRTSWINLMEGGN